MKSIHHQTLKTTLATSSSSNTKVVSSNLPQYIPNIPNKVFFSQSTLSDNKETNNSSNVNLDRNKSQQGVKRKYTRSDKTKQSSSQNLDKDSSVLTNNDNIKES